MSLFDLWQALASETDAFVRAQLAYVFEPYKAAVSAILTADARHYSRLGAYDERAYERLTQLRTVYGEAAVLIEASAEAHPTVNELLAGIYDILQSRLREFDETAPQPDDANPVIAEKQGIIEKSLLYIQRQMDDQANHSTLPPDAQAALRGAFLLGEGAEAALRNHLAATAFDTLYVHYQDSLRFCLLGLDDLHARKTAQLYMELIVREWEVLHDLICVQANALEAALTEDTNPREGDTPERVLRLLREAYQQIGPLAKELQQLANAGTPRTEPEPNCRDLAAFTRALAQVALPPITAAMPDTTPFFDALTEETDARFGARRITFLKAAYQLQRRVGDEILLAEEASAVFKDVYDGLLGSEMNDDAPTEEKQIIAGITETMEIKISSLKDSIADFNGESASLLQAFAKEKTDVTDEIKAAAYPVVRAAWLAAPPATPNEVLHFFVQCEAGDAFAPSRDEYEKHVTRYTEKMAKAALRFRREILLYEVATYEEILTHSVSRLHKSDNVQVKSMAARLEYAYAALEVLLRKNNITPIRPDPHEPFNGKEHEVLVAEKHEGFEKGEIIKRVGSGYRCGELVLLRANVIAAK